MIELKKTALSRLTCGGGDRREPSRRPSVMTDSSRFLTESEIRGRRPNGATPALFPPERGDHRLPMRRVQAGILLHSCYRW